MTQPSAGRSNARRQPENAPRPALSVVEWLKAHPNTIRTAAVIAFFVFWEFAARGMNTLFISYPTAIFRAAWTITESGELPQAFLTSMEPFVLGLAISIIGGVIIGVLIAQFWFIEYTLDPFINALYAVPRIALLPLIMLWAGLDVTGKVAIIVSVAIFPVIINTYSGIKDVRGNLIEIGRAYCATEWQIFTKIVLPAAVPYIMAGIRLAVGLAIIGMIVAEFFTSVSGLGGLIVLYANSFATAKLFVMIIVVGLLGAVLSELVIYIERRFSRWRVSERERY